MPVSYLWYGALSDFNCKETGLGQNHIAIELEDEKNDCTQQTSSHWMVFYGFNATIYGVPLMTLILKLKRK
jgi:hypothetical protein